MVSSRKNKKVSTKEGEEGEGNPLPEVIEMEGRESEV